MFEFIRKWWTWFMKKRENDNQIHEEEYEDDDIAAAAANAIAFEDARRLCDRISEVFKFVFF
jgi:hypothetical protein